MIPSKGVGNLLGLSTLETRPGPKTAERLFLRLYQLACQKTNLKRRKEWAEQQKKQALIKLGVVQRQISSFGKLAFVKIGSSANPGKEETVKQENPAKGGAGKKWSEFPLKY